MFDVLLIKLQSASSSESKGLLQVTRDPIGRIMAEHKASENGGDIRGLRLASGIAQSELAAKARVSLAELRRWERGFELPPKPAIARLAQALAVSPRTLEKHQRQHLKAATPGEGYTTVKASNSHEVLAREKSAPARAYRVLDLFCGSGGFSYGFEQTGRFAVTAGIDLLADRVGTFRANHKHASTIVGDIRTFPTKALGDESLNPDVIIGGPPCQGFSSIRPFRVCTVGDPRNNLFEHFAIVVSELRPRWFVLENVVGLLTHDGGRAFPALLESFKQTGYTTDWRVLNAANYGLPQNRERVVVVGSRDAKRFEWPQPTHVTNHRSMAGPRANRMFVDPLFSEPLPPAIPVKDAIHDLPEIAAGERSDSYRDDVELTAYERRLRNGSEHLTLHDATGHSEKMLEIIRAAGTNRWALPEGMTTSGFSSCYSRLEADLPSVTLTVNFVHPSSNKCIHPYQHRALTPREGARLQGFPDGFEFVGTRTQIVKQIGNAVPPLLGQTIADALTAQW